MPTNTIVFERALHEWDDHVRYANYSQPPHIGATALLMPFNHAVRDSKVLEGETYDDLRRATLLLAAHAARSGIEPLVAVDATETDFEEALSNHKYSHIMVIGHGCLSSVEVQNNARPVNEQRLDWLNIATMATHLKTGRFMHLTCATLPRRFNVPLGLFAVNDHRNIYAALGSRIKPADFNFTRQGLVQPITDVRRLDYEGIKAAFPQRNLTVTQEAHVLLGSLKQVLLDKINASK